MSAWQPIETAPRDGTRILGVTAEGYIDVYQWEPQRYHTRKNPYWNVVWAPVGFSRERQPVFWMPLPSPPSEVALAYEPTPGGKP